MAKSRNVSPELEDELLSFAVSRESEWLPSATPPVAAGAYLTRNGRGLAIRQWRNQRWQLARGESAPAEWKGVDVRLTETERVWLKNRLFHKQVAAALPLLRDAFASFATAKAERSPSKEDLVQRKLTTCRYFLMLRRDARGKKLLTKTDLALVRPLISSLKPRQRADLERNLFAFEKGVDL